MDSSSEAASGTLSLNATDCCLSEQAYIFPFRCHASLTAVNQPRPESIRTFRWDQAATGRESTHSDLDTRSAVDSSLDQIFLTNRKTYLIL